MSNDDYIEAEIVEEGDYAGPQYPAAMTPTARAPRSWDFFLTILLIAVLLVLAVIFVILGFGFGLSTIGCGDSAVACNLNQISFASLLVIIGVPGVTLISIIFSAVWILRRKLSFWIPLVGILVAIGLYVLGGYLVDLAVAG